MNAVLQAFVSTLPDNPLELERRFAPYSRTRRSRSPWGLVEWAIALLLLGLLVPVTLSATFGLPPLRPLLLLPAEFEEPAPKSGLSPEEQPGFNQQ
jgi:hypothetical protein